MAEDAEEEESEKVSNMDLYLSGCNRGRSSHISPLVSVT